MKLKDKELKVEGSSRGLILELVQGDAKHTAVIPSNKVYPFLNLLQGKSTTYRANAGKYTIRGKHYTYQKDNQNLEGVLISWFAANSKEATKPVASISLGNKALERFIKTVKAAAKNIPLISYTLNNVKVIKTPLAMSIIANDKEVIINKPNFANLKDLLMEHIIKEQPVQYKGITLDVSQAKQILEVLL